MITYTLFESAFHKSGAVVKEPFEDFAASHGVHTLQSKKDGPCIILGAYAGPKRSKAGMLYNTMIAVEIDGKGEKATTFKEMEHLLEGMGVQYMLYTTYSHRPDAPRMRVLFPLTVTLPAHLYAEAYGNLIAYLQESGVAGLDTTQSDPAGLHYLPAHHFFVPHWNCAMNTERRTCLDWAGYVADPAAPRSENWGAPEKVELDDDAEPIEEMPIWIREKIDSPQNDRSAAAYAVMKGLLEAGHSGGSVLNYCEAQEGWLGDWITEKPKAFIATLQKAVREVEVVEEMFDVEDEVVSPRAAPAGNVVPIEQAKKEKLGLAQDERSAAKMFAKAAEGRAYWVGAMKSWFVKKDHYFKIDDCSAILGMIGDTLWTKQLADALKVVDKEKPLAKMLLKMQKLVSGEGSLTRIAKLARRYMSLPVEDLDANEHILSVANGILDLRTGKLGAQAIVTKRSPTSFDPAATCPRWAKAVEEVCEGDPELIHFMQLFYGTCLSGHHFGEVFYFLHGKGENGKTLINTTIMDILGREYAVKAEGPVFLKSHSGMMDKTRMLGPFRGARMVVGDETGEGDRFDTVLIKDLVGGGIISGRFMRQDAINFRFQGTVILAGNDKPMVRKVHDEGFWRRLIVVPFRHRFRDNVDKDPNLSHTLKAEASGILNWLLEGAQIAYREGIRIPGALIADREEYKLQINYIAEFICCYYKKEPDAQECRLSDVLYLYKQWAKDNGFPQLNRNQFSEAMAEEGFPRIRSHGIRYYKNLKGAGVDFEK